MSALDWFVLVGTTAAIAIWGAWKNRGANTTDQYLRGSQTLRWPTVGLSIMATQASAVTFLSTPGQGYADGMRFIQFYFGLPLAMIVISAVFVPIYYRLKVYTAYEYLESRFDMKTRVLGASLFLIQRGLAAGITIYAPALILSVVLGWDVPTTTIAIGGVTALYTLFGGADAVSQTQKQQMAIMLGGLVLAAVLVVQKLPPDVGLGDAVAIAGALGRMNVVDFSFDLTSRYNVWSGVLGGFFLALSYFGTDQSQVGRYLGGKSVTESRLGLLFNGVLKIPMQFVILFVGVMVLVFHQFDRPPLSFNPRIMAALADSAAAPELATLDREHALAFETTRTAAVAFVAARHDGDAVPEAIALREAAKATAALRARTQELVKKTLPGIEAKDTDYMFIGFVLDHLPAGVVGLLIAVILAAAMSSASSELNALAATSSVDLYRRAFRPGATDAQLLRASKGFTLLWAGFAIAFAMFASRLDNLIQAVNVLGSLFYGTVLGIFVVAFFIKHVRGTPVFVAALLSEAVVIGLWLTTDIGFLWFNVIGCALVAALSMIIQAVRRVPAG